MAELAAAGTISAAVAAKPASREKYVLEKYFRRVSANFTKLTTAFLVVENAPLTGVPSEEDLEVAMMAQCERQDMYEAMQVGQYRPDPSTKAELRAIT